MPYDLVVANGLYDLTEERYAVVLALIDKVEKESVKNVCAYLGHPYTHLYHLKKATSEFVASYTSSNESQFSRVLTRRSSGSHSRPGSRARSGSPSGRLAKEVVWVWHAKLGTHNESLKDHFVTIDGACIRGTGEEDEVRKRTLTIPIGKIICEVHPSDPFLVQPSIRSPSIRQLNMSVDGLAEFGDYVCLFWHRNKLLVHKDLSGNQGNFLHGGLILYREGRECQCFGFNRAEGFSFSYFIKEMQTFLVWELPKWNSRGVLKVITLSDAGEVEVRVISLAPFITRDGIDGIDGIDRLFPSYFLCCHGDRLLFNAVNRFYSINIPLWLRLSDEEPTFRSFPDDPIFCGSSARIHTIDDDTLLQTLQTHQLLYRFDEGTDSYSSSTLDLFTESFIKFYDDITHDGDEYRSVLNGEYLAINFSHGHSGLLLLFPIAVPKPFAFEIVTNDGAIDSILMCSMTRRLFVARAYSGGQIKNKIYVIDAKMIDDYFSSEDSDRQLNLDTDEEDMIAVFEAQRYGNPGRAQLNLDTDEEDMIAVFEAQQYGNPAQSLHLEGDMLFVRFGAEYEIFSV